MQNRDGQQRDLQQAVLALADQPGQHNTPDQSHEAGNDRGGQIETKRSANAIGLEQHGSAIRLSRKQAHR